MCIERKAITNVVYSSNISTSYVFILSLNTAVIYHLMLLLALFEQRLLLQSLTWVILWVVLGKKPMAIAADARLVPRNTPIAIAPKSALLKVYV